MRHCLTKYAVPLEWRFALIATRVSLGITLMLSVRVGAAVPAELRSTLIAGSVVPALAQRTEVSDSPKEGTASQRKAEADRLLQRGIQQFKVSQFAAALQSWQQALVIYREIKDRLGEGKSLGNLGLAYQFLGNYAKAIEYQEQSLAIARELKDRLGEGQSLGNLGLAYYSLGNYAKAIEYQEQHLAIARELKDRLGEGQSLGNLGLAYQFLGNYAKAIEYQEQSLVIAREIKDRLGEGQSLGNLGLAYYSLGNYAKAIEYQEQSLAITREIKDRRGEGNALDNLGNAYLSLGNYAKAINYYEQSLAIAREIKDRNGERIALNNIGNALKKKQQPDLAIVFYKQSVNVSESILQDIRPLSRDLQASYIESVSKTYRNLADLLLSKGDILGAQQVLELLKIQELRELDRTTRAKISSTGKVDLDPTEQLIIDKYGSYITFAQKLQACQTKKPVCPEYDELNNLWKQNQKEYNQGVASLEAEVKQRKQQDEQYILDPKNDLSKKAAEIIQDNKTALVYVFVTDQRLWLILATKNEVLRKFEIEVDRATLSTEVVAFRELMESCQKHPCTDSDTAQLQAVSQKLHHWLMPELLQKELKGKINHLVFSLDRNLRYIPMGALYDGKRYLIQDYAVSTIASAKFNSTDPFGSQPINVLAAGFSEAFPPAFPNPLTNVPIELRAIVKTNAQDPLGTYPGTILLNQAFNQNSLQKNLFGNNILHLATHGEFVSKSNTASYILSGDKQELTISQIEDLRGLGDLKLVVLSACQTALGKEGQDGVELNSISISFLSKGAKSVMASLWDVNDISTSLLMQRFYHNLATAPMSRAEALQRAQLSFLNGEITATDGDRLRARADPKAPPVTSIGSPDFKHPYYWSPFVLIGSGF